MTDAELISTQVNKTALERFSHQLRVLSKMKNLPERLSRSGNTLWISMAQRSPGICRINSKNYRYARYTTPVPSTFQKTETSLTSF